MTCYYYFTIRFFKGSQPFDKVYCVSVLDISDFLSFLDSRHKDNYSIIDISKFRKVGASLYEKG